MTSAITLARITTLIVVILWFILYWQGGRQLVMGLRSRSTDPTRYNDRPLVLIILVLSMIVWISGLLILRNRIHWIESEVTRILAFVGLGLVLIGTMGVSFSRRQLGPYWSADTHVRQDHQVVASGPYRIVRHPLYAFAILQCIGTCMVFPTILNITSSILICLCFVLKTIGEDRNIASRISGYQEYARQVPYLLIPRIW